MKKAALLLFLSFLALAYGSSNQTNTTNVTNNSCLPNQIHIGFGDAYLNSLYNYNTTASGDSANASVLITWQTKQNCTNNYIKITSKALNFTEILTYNQLWNDDIDTDIPTDSMDPSDKGELYTSFSYTAMLNNIQPGTNYTYYIFQNGTNGNGTQNETNNTNLTYAGPFTFSVPSPNPIDQYVSLLLYGDIDTTVGNQTINSFATLARQNASQLTGQICLGDIGYNIYSEGGLSGEYFFNSMQNVSAIWPFMMTPGNHEYAKNYSFLDFRLKMPLYNQTSNQYYSFNLGRIHFIGVNYNFYLDGTTQEQNQMWTWLQNDLQNANATRDERPWIVVFTHYPIYCSYNNYSDPTASLCNKYYGKFQIWDQLWYNYRVDLVLQSHVHYWERLGPIYSNQSQPFFQYSWDINKNYIINPQAPVYTVDGSSGNNDSLITNPTPLLNYSINCSTALGYSTLTLVNDSCLLYQHFSSSNQSLLDFFYLEKGNEYPYPQNSAPADNEIRSMFWVYFSAGLIAAIILFMLAFGYKSHKEVTKSSLYFKQGDSSFTPIQWR